MRFQPAAGHTDAGPLARRVSAGVQRHHQWHRMCAPVAGGGSQRVAQAAARATAFAPSLMACFASSPGSWGTSGRGAEGSLPGKEWRAAAGALSSLEAAGRLHARGGQRLGAGVLGQAASLAGDPVGAKRSGPSQRDGSKAADTQGGTWRFGPLSKRSAANEFTMAIAFFDILNLPFRPFTTLEM